MRLFNAVIQCGYSMRKRDVNIIYSHLLIADWMGIVNNRSLDQRKRGARESSLLYPHRLLV
jgi:hypothetical protein